MKNILAICFCFFMVSSAYAQYYLRGEIKDENNMPLSNVRMLLHSSGYIYYSGSEGAFGIPIPKSVDSLTITADGFQPYQSRLDASTYQYITLKKMNYKQASSVPRNRLMSFTKNLKPDDWHGWTVAAETYSSLIENDFIPTSRFPETGFTININKASYSNVRR
ncbi:MAG TPA: von Willebrand factor type A domain-containing protein, partial [Puia sp.]|nr:von Willebrand factor type A domain-containing protein [Puia sp.]